MKFIWSSGYSKLRTGSIVLASLAVLLLWVQLGLYLHVDKSQTIDSAERASVNLARAFEENVNSLFRSLDQSLRVLVLEYERDPAGFDPGAILAKISDLGSTIFQASRAGADGYTHATSLSPAQGSVFIGDREHFLAHVERDTGEMFVSKPVVGRLSGRHSIQFSRRVNKPDGSFGGVMVLSVDPLHLSRFYRSMDLGPHSIITLVGHDRIVRVRIRGDGGITFGSDVSASTLWPTMEAGSRGTELATSPVDGEQRLMIHRRLESYPLVVLVGVSTKDVLAGFETRKAALVVAATGLSVIIVLSAAWFLHQVNRQHRIETALRRNEQELILSRDEAHRASHAKSAFLANMSHELRTPLNAIIGFSDFMASGGLGPAPSPRYFEYAYDIKKSGQHLLDMISDLLDMAKIESEQYDLWPETTEIAAIIGFALRLVEPQARAGGVEMVTTLDPDARLLHVDPRALKQILLNLLSNAVKFTPAGGSVELSAAPADKDFVRLAVHDTGIGISQADLGRLGEPFQRGGDAWTRQSQGTGLGLWITKRLVQAHAGSFAIDSAPGKGTTITITLPSAAGSVAPSVPVRRMA